MKIELFRGKYEFVHSAILAAFPTATIVDRVFDFGHSYDVMFSVGLGPQQWRYSIPCERWVLKPEQKISGWAWDEEVGCEVPLPPEGGWRYELKTITDKLPRIIEELNAVHALYPAAP